MDTIKIALVAACDRNNYGDVLLPIIFEDYVSKNVCENNISCDFFSLSEKDMTSVGGRNVKKMNDCFIGYDGVVVCGGELLATPYNSMLLHLQTNVFLEKLLVEMRKISWRVSEVIAKCILGGKEMMPWMIFPKNGQKLFYISVGGIGMSYLKNKAYREWDRIIARSVSFSVRDVKTYTLSKKMANFEKIQLIPDMAIIMSELYGEKIESEIDGQKYIEGSYYVIQTNLDYGKKIKDEIICTIKSIFHKSGRKCILLPIGLCAGHSDYEILSQISERVRNEANLVIPQNIYEVMAIIANSDFFVGTSLHGVITAASYGVPHTVLCKEAEKTIQFIKTWKTTDIVYLENVSDLIEKVNVLLDKGINVENVKEMKAMVNGNLNQIIQNILRK